jgi:hypothetical protein
MKICPVVVQLISCKKLLEAQNGYYSLDSQPKTLCAAEDTAHHMALMVIISANHL